MNQDEKCCKCKRPIEFGEMVMCIDCASSSPRLGTIESARVEDLKSKLQKAMKVIEKIHAASLFHYSQKLAEECDDIYKAIKELKGE